MFQFIRNFAKSEDGAVTVDWVVLTAAIVALVAGSVPLINDGVVSLSESTGERVESIQPATPD